MKHRDEFRDRELAARMVRSISEISRTEVRFMEICGTHTVSILRSGIKSALPGTISLISGPGCPVCVTSAEEMDRCISLSRIPGLTVATFGDLVRVPGTESSLREEQAAGAEIRVVYSSLDALQLAREDRNRKVVFLGIGFETTIPTVAAAILQASKEGLDNFMVLSCHKLLPPALAALLESDEVRIDGFLCPGHVTTIIGTAPYLETAGKHGKPCVVSGFEPVDILQSIHMLIRQVEQNECRVEIQYGRAVSAEGNRRARQVMEQVFEPRDSTWRGLGPIPGSGLRLRPEFAAHDAEARFEIETPEARENPACRCGQVLRGAVTPPDCSLFGKGCDPRKPLGPCMVSSEGTCAAYYRYRNEEVKR
jgi:hydrogenase expression/formation protein HypD